MKKIGNVVKAMKSKILSDICLEFLGVRKKLRNW